MGDDSPSRDELREQISELRRRLREAESRHPSPERQVQSSSASLVDVPQELASTFQTAQEYVTEYFSSWWQDPALARIEFSGERYILIRAASMSIEFYDLVTSLYRDRGPEVARSVAQGFLFDVAHSLGKADAARFHERMGVTDPVEKLSAGPVHFALAGWARVSILPESRPSPDENYFLTYDHPHSFEAEAWMERGQKPGFPVCVMNGGYSSGWCEQSFGLPLVAYELTCRAKGDACCRFVMAPPSRIQGHIDRLLGEQKSGVIHRDTLDVPEFFRRKRLEDDLRRARDELERRVVERTAELERRNAEMRQANRQLEELQQARAAFVATISHELRTPLVTGLGYLELVLGGKLGAISAEASAGLRVSLRNLQRLSSLVDEILGYHRLTGAQDRPEPGRVTFDIGLVCRECREDFLVRTGWSRERIRLWVPEEPSWVLADPEMIRRVIVNLLDNAERHGGGGTRIALSVTGRDGRVVVTVEDDGRGMAPGFVDRATQPFARLGSSTQGLGLGLAIVKSILEAHDSELSLSSGEGQGTRASFSLPSGGTARPEPSKVAVAEPEPSKVVGKPHSSKGIDPMPGSQEAAAARGARILLVEDDEDTAGFVALALGGEGYRVTSVASSEEALEKLETQAFDLMLVDLTLPGMNGAELCGRIKADPGRSHVPVYLFTARAEVSAREEARAANCDGYLIKPIGVPDLLARIQGALAANKGR